MGKHGPCHHCGVTSTPLWRNGPPEKPILCNACGSRWRTKGSLANYTPLHSRELIETQEVKITKVKSITFKPKDQKFPKKKQWNNFVDYGHAMLHPEQNCRKVLEEDPSNRSSSGSAVSYSESCAYIGTTDTYDYAGSAQSNVWDSMLPARKRTGVTRPRPSSVEKLTKDLHSILHEQQSSYHQGSSEDDLLYERETPWGSFEIGYGSVLIRHPNTNKRPTEEESEASSLPMNSRSYVVNESYSVSDSIFVDSEMKEASSINACTEKYKSAVQTAQQHIKRDNTSNGKCNILHVDSLLCSSDLMGIVNLEIFMKYFTDEERQELMKLLPSLDTAKLPDSLGSMFTSFQFVKTTSYFQQLLCYGIFDLSHPEPKHEDYESLRKLILGNLTSSVWVEHHKKLKDVKLKQIAQAREPPTGSNCLGASPFSTLKRLRGHLSFPDAKGTLRSPKRISKSSDLDRTSNKAHMLHSSNCMTGSNWSSDEFIDKEESSFSPRNLFAVPLQFFDDSSEQDLLLEAPRNAPTPEAELLYHPWKQTTAPSSSIVDSELADGEESRSNFPSGNGHQTRCY